MHFQTKLCPHNPEHTIRNRRSSPLRLEYHGSAATDFLWTSYCEPIVGEKVVDAFESASIVGCEFVPIELENTMGDEIASELFEMRPTGWGGMAAKSSGVRVLEECSFCKRRVFSTFTNAEELFDVDAWDGSDVFTIWPLPRYILSTSSVRDLLKKNQFSGVRLFPINRLPKTIAGTLTPGNVRDWFDEEQASKFEAEIDAAI